ncbi:type II toxin-antitoxin system RelE/ParE family toxin [Candidatus Giovannonibacteria bacterium]|nr:type II toxin-antitoxin system RelE/ParE family toxin [Candidatus Giovannonibacteria bacterium]
MPMDPFFGDIQKMKGEKNTWRRRIGSYRLFYKIYSDKKIILVFRLERRTSKTY